MSIGNSLLAALIVMSITFCCLIALCLFVQAQSYVFSFINKSQKRQESEEEIAATSIEESTGELKLIGVDEKTSAMIMALVSDELKIPLDELQFKSIKHINS